MKIILKTFFALASISLICDMAFAAKRQAGPATISSIEASTTPDSSAYFISLTGSPANSCSNKLYIPLEEKTVFSTALTAQLNNKAVNVIWEDTATTYSSYASGNSSCKVISLWW